MREQKSEVCATGKTATSRLLLNLILLSQRLQADFAGTILAFRVL
jgi:hypothetical protein